MIWIKEIIIKNFRGIDIELLDLKRNFLIVGKNDAGKSTFFYAIRKVLDYRIRRNPLFLTDSTNNNAGKISIKIVLCLSELSDENRSIIGKLIDENTDGVETITINLNATFNSSTNSYDEELIFGIKDTKELSPFKINELDSVLEIFYTYPNYDLGLSKNNFFSNYAEKNKEDKLLITTQFKDEIIRLNNIISENVIVKKMQDKVNNIPNSMKNVIKNQWIIKSKIKLNNIYNSLDIVPILDSLSENIDEYEIGDGGKKFFSLNLEYQSSFNSKEKIILSEEPENNLYPIYQKQFLTILNDLNPSQIIVATHSPTIIDFNKIFEIVKFQKTSSFKWFKSPMLDENGFSKLYEKFGYMLNEEFSKCFFCDEIILVEGYSERNFYNWLENGSQEIRNIFLKKNIGVIPVYGSNFEKALELLITFGVKINILTDNDFNYTKGKNNVIFSGIKRCYSILKKWKEIDSHFINIYPDWEKDFSILKNYEESITKHDVSVVKEMEDRSVNVVNILKKYNIFLHNNIKENFECAVADFFEIPHNEKKGFIDELSKKKMINLHEILLEHYKDIKDKITDKQKENILLKFLYD